MAVAVNEGKPTYRSYLIVPATRHPDPQHHGPKGGVFAYADPYSNTGYLVPRFEIKRNGGDPGNFLQAHFLHLVASQGHRRGGGRPGSGRQRWTAMSGTC